MFSNIIYELHIKNIYDIEVCLIFDEVDKFGSKYDDSFLLNILDGVGESGKLPSLGQNVRRAAPMAA